MGIQIAVLYKKNMVRYDVVAQDEQIFHLKLDGNNHSESGEYIPEKIIIRRKGKIWISDMDNYNELIDALTRELIIFNSNPDTTVD
jgi:hypothetical protein